uniref:CST complex subunit STN1 n=1 Tax=Albugo laibachii Nc14 TaxID=890382 RepID=F0WE83_9STRA|nr:expressed protein putative [Albugo laibachii Nc14]|eukprot:CCA19512.1 expressed protein putative [Albugo laibachii Nc14]
MSIKECLVEYDGIPGSIAWPVLESASQDTGILTKRLITKAQICGIVISIQHKAERVEFLVDDGTALIPAVLWLPEAGQERSLAINLGDLVNFEGKLQREARRDDLEEPNQIELRVLRYSIVQDPNEEMEHWLNTMRLCREVYSSPQYLVEPRGQPSFVQSGLFSSQAKESGNVTRHEDGALEAFLHMELDSNSMQTSENDFLDQLSIDVIKKLMEKQRKSANTCNPISVTFMEILEEFEADGKIQIKHEFVRRLRLVFSELRSIGLLYHLDPETDIHVFQTYLFTLKPALLSFLQDSSCGQSFTDIAGAILQKDEFQHISIEWLQHSIRKLNEEGIIRKQNDTFCIVSK